MPIVFCNSNDKAYQRGLNALLTPVFFDFSFWYDLNLWDERYESYAIAENDEFLANICVFKTDILWHGELHRALSIGAVAVHPAHRGKGYARQLFEHILAKYPNTPMYLAPNDDVLDFYPRFGFRMVHEKQPIATLALDNTIAPRRLSKDDPKVWNYVAQRGNFSGILDCANTETVAMFHIHREYCHDCLYELPELNALLVATQEGDTLHMAGLFARQPVTWAQLWPRLPFAGVRRVTFGFMPDALGVPYRMEAIEDDRWFVRGIKSELQDVKFPEMSAT